MEDPPSFTGGGEKNRGNTAWSQVHDRSERGEKMGEIPIVTTAHLGGVDHKSKDREISEREFKDGKIGDVGFSLQNPDGVQVDFDSSVLVSFLDPVAKGGSKSHLRAVDLRGSETDLVSAKKSHGVEANEDEICTLVGEQDKITSHVQRENAKDDTASSQPLASHEDGSVGKVLETRAQMVGRVSAWKLAPLSPSKAGGVEAPLNMTKNPMVDLSNTDEFPALGEVRQSRPPVVTANVGGGGSNSISSDVGTRVGEVHRGAHSKPLFSKIVDKSHGLTQYTIDVPIASGLASAVVPAEVLHDARPLWTDLLVGRFPDEAPHIAKIHVIVNKIWPLGVKDLKIDAFVINERMVKFRIQNDMVRTRVLRRGMWNIAGKPMVISKWSPYIEETQPALTALPLWVLLKEVPRSLFTDKGLSWLASLAGKPEHLHQDTVLCKSFEEAKIFVTVDLQKELPKEFEVTENGVTSTVTYHYPWLPPRCMGCAKWGHVQDQCLVQALGDQGQAILNKCNVTRSRHETIAEKGDKGILDEDLDSVGAATHQDNSYVPKKTEKVLENNEEKTRRLGVPQVDSTAEIQLQIGGVAKTGDEHKKEKADVVLHSPIATGHKEAVDPAETSEKSVQVASTNLSEPTWAHQAEDKQEEDDEDADDEDAEVEPHYDSEHSAATTRSLRPRHNRQDNNKKHQSPKQKEKGKKSPNKNKNNSGKKKQGTKGRCRY